MQIHITPRNLKLTAAIHGFVAEKVEHLEHATDQIMGAHVVLWYDETKAPSKKFHVKVHLALPGPDIHAEEARDDLYAAVDVVADKLARQLRKRKTSLVKKTRTQAQRTRERQKSSGKRRGMA